jgi:MFS transporter, CP family, cyanate transporter
MSLVRSLKAGLPIFLIATNMRAGLILIGPLLPILQQQYGIGVITEAVLGAAPLICFSLSALFMARLIRWADTNRIVTYGITLITASLLLRTLFELPGLLVFSVTLGIAVAVLNYMLPVWVRENNTGNPGLVTGTYAALMGIFSAIALAITVPLAEATDLSWRLSMLPWFVLGLAATILWWAKFRGKKMPKSTEKIPSFWRSPILHNRKAWSLTLLFGMLNMIHYASAIWMPTILVSKGMELIDTGFLVALATLIGSLLSLLVPHFAARGRDFRAPLIGFSLVLVFAYISIAVSSGPILWPLVILANIGVYTTFSLALFLVVHQSSNEDTTKNLSIMMQSFGYLLATTAPILLGVAFLITGSWGTSLFVLVGLAAVQILLSFKTGNKEKI